ncbi:uncharacterized protein [Aquarana catesbeiana]|uniref:uncharacterized protein n=1 Tax=Aquarana catesbeiana TaxID=8400 RepID=UPI003CC94B19
MLVPAILYIYFLRSAQGLSFPSSPYYLVKQSLTWVEALNYCRTQYTDLASIESDTELMQVSAVALLSEVWVGLYLCSPGLWRWSTGNALGTYTKWNSGMPGLTSYSCARYSLLKWNDGRCDSKFYFVCYKATNTTAPNIPATCQWPLVSTTVASLTNPINESTPIGNNQPTNGPTNGFNQQNNGMNQQNGGGGNQQTNGGIQQITGVNQLTNGGIQQITGVNQLTNGGIQQITGVNQLTNDVSQQANDVSQQTDGFSIQSPGLTIQKRSISLPQGSLLDDSFSSSSSSSFSSSVSSLVNDLLAHPEATVQTPSTATTTSSVSTASTRSSTSSTSSSTSPASSSQSSRTHTASTRSSTSSTSSSTSPTSSSQSSGTVTGSTSFSTASQVWTGPNGAVLGMLHLVLTPMSWLNARLYCRSNFTDMAAVLSQQDQNNVAALLSPYTPSTGFWIGLRFNRFKSNWYWIGRQLWGGFSYWESGEPDTPFTNACGMISGAPAQNFTWGSNCCTQELPFICYEGS